MYRHYIKILDVPAHDLFRCVIDENVKSSELVDVGFDNLGRRFSLLEVGRDEMDAALGGRLDVVLHPISTVEY